MVIQFTTIKQSSSNRLGTVAVLASLFLFFILPSFFIIFSYVDKPTGSLISPLPDTVVGSTPAPTTAQAPIIAAPQETSTPSSSTLTTGNSISGKAVIKSGYTDTIVKDAKITTDSQIIITPEKGDSNVYFVKSKGDSYFTLSSINPVSTNKTIDYQIVNP